MRLPICMWQVRLAAAVLPGCPLTRTTGSSSQGISARLCSIWSGPSGCCGHGSGSLSGCLATTTCGRVPLTPIEAAVSADTFAKSPSAESWAC
jgi:hypothetical protein